MGFDESGETVGTKNVKLAVEWLRARSIAITARRTGGKNGLLIRLHTATGMVLVRKIISTGGSDAGGPSPSYDSRLGEAAVSP
jgi:chemotaxis protein CheD